MSKRDVQDVANDATVGNNPANRKESRVTAATRIPMSMPTQKLQIPELEGYHAHWFLARNVAKAQAAGYEFVDNEEVSLNAIGVADNLENSGNTDIGTRVSIIGGTDDRDQPERLYLMKIREEWWQEDQKSLAKRNDQIAQTLRGGLLGAEGDPDRAKRYLKQGQELFLPKRN